MAAMSMAEKDDFVPRQHAITCSTNIVSPIGENTNSQGYCNHLYKNNEIVEYNNLKSVISSDNNRDQVVEA